MGQDVSYNPLKQRPYDYKQSAGSGKNMLKMHIRDDLDRHASLGYVAPFDQRAGIIKDSAGRYMMGVFFVLVWVFLHNLVFTAISTG